MKLKIYGGILLVISIFLIFGGSSIQFLDAIKMDQEAVRKLEMEIDNSYIEITNQMKSLHRSMVEMQGLFSLYYENLMENKMYYQSKFVEIQTQKIKIEKQLQNMTINCHNTVNKNSKEKCKSVEKNNEIAQDSYANLEHSYTKFINGHTEWTENNKVIVMN